MTIEKLTAIVQQLAEEHNKLEAKVERLEFEACKCVLDPEDGSTIQHCELHPEGGSPRQKLWSRPESNIERHIAEAELRREFENQ